MRANPIGVIVVILGVSASFFISTSYGWSLADDPAQAACYAMIGAAAVLFEVVGLHRSAVLRQEKRWFAAVACVFGVIVAAAVNTGLEIGFLATTTEKSSTENGEIAKQRRALEDERTLILSQLQQTGALRALPAIEAEIAAVHFHPNWQSSHECTDATIAPSVELCKRYGALQVEKGAAIAVRDRQLRVETINQRLSQMKAVQIADPRAAYFASLTGHSEMTIKTALSLLVVLFLRITTSIAAFVMWPLRPRATENSQSADSVAPVVKLERAPMPELSLLDHALADEEISDQLTEADIELVLGSIRERLTARKVARDNPPAATDENKIRSTDFLVAMMEAEDFAHECLEFGAEDQYQTRASDMQAAFRIWGRDRMPEISASLFSEAMTTVLQGRGGHKQKRGGYVYYIGASLREGCLQEVLPPKGNGVVSLDRSRRLGRGLREMTR